MTRKFLKALGIVSQEENLACVSPSPFLLAFNFHEIHESGVIRARPEEIIAAVAGLDMRDDRVADVLLSIREWPLKMLRKSRKGMQHQETAPFGFHTFTLLQRTQHEISRGLAGRFWRPDLEIRHISSAREFEVLDDHSVAKLVLRFQAIEHQEGVCTLRTETFVYCANTRTRMLFTPYWLGIRLSSGWIRRRTLASIERQLLSGAH